MKRRGLLLLVNEERRYQVVYVYLISFVNLARIFEELLHVSAKEYC